MNKQSTATDCLRLKYTAIALVFTGLITVAAAAAPLNISKTDGLGTDECVAENGRITYAICYDNTVNGFDVHNVVITDNLPPGSTFISADNQGGYDAAAHAVRWDFASLAAGAESACVQLVVGVTAPPDSLLVNEVSIASDETDPNVTEESTLVCPIPVFVDIKPGGCPTPVNVGSQGVLPVAVLGTANFDVQRIDPASITLAGVAPLRWALEDVATPYTLNMDECDIHDCHALGEDGYIDLTLKFDTQAVAQAIGEVFDRDCLHLELRGKLKESYGGTSIRGYDVVSILKKGKKTIAPVNSLLLKK